MIVNISELENNQIYKFDIDEDFKELDAHAYGNIEIKLLGDFVLVQGILEVNIELECSRCLKKFKDTLNVNIDEKFYKGIEKSVTSKERQLKHKDFIEDLEDNEEIDLSDLIYQSIIINVPSQVLCNENCEGTEELKKHIKADENIQTIEIPLKLKNNKN